MRAHCFFHSAEWVRSWRSLFARWPAASFATSNSSVCSKTASSLAVDTRTVSVVGRDDCGAGAEAGSSAGSGSAAGGALGVSGLSTAWSERVKSATEVFAAGAAASMECSSRPSVSTERCSVSNNSGDRGRSPRFIAANTLSNAWQTASTSATFTARAAPFRLWAVRKTISRLSPLAVRSSSTRPEAMLCKCSCASTLNMESRRLRISSSLPGIVVN